MIRFIVYAVPLLVLLLALFGFAVELLDAEPRRGSVIRLALFEQPRVPGQLVVGTWLVEASGLIALFLLAQGRFAVWWLDGLVAGWVAWVFRGPLLVITIVVAARQPQDPWWKLAFGWWVLYSICGLSLAILARRSKLEPWIPHSTRPAEEPEAKSEALETAEVDLAVAETGSEDPPVELAGGTGPEPAKAERESMESDMPDPSDESEFDKSDPPEPPDDAVKT